VFFYDQPRSEFGNYEIFEHCNDCGLKRKEFKYLFEKILNKNPNINIIVNGDNLLTYCVKYYNPGISDYFIKRLIDENIDIQEHTFDRCYDYPDEYTQEFLEITNEYI